MEVSNNAGMGPAVQLKILLAIVHGTFEINLRISDCMKFDAWMKYGHFASCCLHFTHVCSCVKYTNDILNLLESTPNLYFRHNMADEEEKLIVDEKDHDQTYRVGGSLVTLIENLDNEYTKILQQADCHSNDYIEK